MAIDTTGQLVSAYYDTWQHGIASFDEAGLRGLRMLTSLRVGQEAACMYDCDVSQPAGTFRFAEFLRIDNGKIQEVKLVFDATEFRKPQ